jgi:hypothetical protein
LPDALFAPIETVGVIVSRNCDGDALKRIVVDVDTGQ